MKCDKIKKLKIALDLLSEVLLECQAEKKSVRVFFVITNDNVLGTNKKGKPKKRPDLKIV